MSLDKLLLEKVENLVKPSYEKLTHWEHGWSHILDVKKISDKLCSAEKVDFIPCGIIVYCHDLGRLYEEQGSIDNSLEGCRDHARLSIEPTVKILQQVGITGDYFNYILEAVAVHSYLNYNGNNIFAKILRDSDKLDAFNPRGLLRTVKFQFRKDFVNTEDILNNWDDDEKINILADQTLELIKKDNKLSKEYVETGLSKVLEWVDEKMFHFHSVYALFKEEIEYTQNLKKILLYT